jgi:hypothetical protein
VYVRNVQLYTHIYIITHTIIHHQLHIYKLYLKINFTSKIICTYIHIIYIYIKKKDSFRKNIAYVSENRIYVRAYLLIYN